MSRIDIVRIEEVRRKAGIERELASRAKATYSTGLGVLRCAAD